MQVNNVGELIDFLAQFPRETPLIGYDGSDKDCPIGVYKSDYAADGVTHPEGIVIDLD